MGLLKKLQYKLLEGDIAKGRPSEYLVDKYPMSMLLEKGVFARFENTEFYWDKDVKDLYTLGGEYVGEVCPQYSNENYIVVEDVAEYLNTEETTSYAIYDRTGKCAVPHGCYTTVFKAKDYVILTMPMQDETFYRAYRPVNDKDEKTVMEATGRSMASTLGGSLVYPKPIVLTKDGIINLDYESVCPVPVKEFAEPYENNMVWIGQKPSNQEVAFKFDKRMYITETYRLPMYTHEYLDMFCTEPGTAYVFLLDMENKKRINLRTGENVNLVNLKRTRLSKAERFKTEEVVEKHPAEQVVEEVVEEQAEEEVVYSENDTRVVVLGDSYVGVSQDATLVEDTEVDEEVYQNDESVTTDIVE